MILAGIEHAVKGRNPPGAVLHFLPTERLPAARNFIKRELASCINRYHHELQKNKSHAAMLPQQRMHKAAVIAHV